MLGIRLFDEQATVWDYNRGRALPEVHRPEPTDIAALDKLGMGLRESKWRMSSRTLYNGFFRAWLAFALVNGCAVLPASKRWLVRWLTYMALHYAASTVQTAAAAVVALHLWNDLQHPFKGDSRLQQLLAGIDACGICGSRAPKFIVDSNFVCGMVERFLAKYPVFRDEWFDPWVRSGDKSVVLLRGVAIVLVGLELGVRPSSLARLTTCCWQRRLDGTVAVQIDLAKNVKNGKLFHVVLGRRRGSFRENYSAISFVEEFVFPLMESQQQWTDTSKCCKNKWRTSHCRSCPFIFASWGQRVLDGGRQPQVRPSELGDVVKQWAKRLGRDPKNYSGVSLRRGSTSIAAARKIEKKIRQKHGGWASERMPDIYTEVSKKHQKQVGKAIYRTVQKSKANRGKKVTFDFDV